MYKLFDSNGVMHEDVTGGSVYGIQMLKTVPKCMIKILGTAYSMKAMFRNLPLRLRGERDSSQG